MTITTYRAVEPLYIITLRNNTQAEQLFKSWVRDNRIEHAHITGNRMMLHAQPAFDTFLVTWRHNMSLITVWDTWNRRHIYLD
jgi:hypothetical protein